MKHDDPRRWPTAGRTRAVGRGDPVSWGARMEALAEEQRRARGRHPVDRGARDLWRSVGEIGWAEWRLTLSVAALVGGVAALSLSPHVIRPVADGGAWGAGVRVLSESGGGPGVRARFALCHTGGGVNCVVDGDTIWIGGDKVRIADIDAPETHPPRCAREAELGNRATLRLRELLNAGAVTLTPIDRDTDRYGRLLRTVEVDGRGVGDTLVAEGLARWYGGGRRPWC